MIDLEYRTFSAGLKGARDCGIVECSGTGKKSNDIAFDLFGLEASPDEKQTLADKYWAWRETPHGEEVFAESLSLARKMRDRGFGHYSIDAIVQVIRFHHHLTHGSDDGFKINDHHRAFLAREIMTTDKTLEGFFEIRRQPSVEGAA